MDLPPDLKKDIQQNERRRRRHDKSPINEAMREFIDGLSENRKLHLSAKKIKRLEMEQMPECAAVGKPGSFSVERQGPVMTGFWYGIDGSWADWCLSEHFRGGERYFYELELDVDKLCVIKTIPEFEAFEDEYLGSSLWEKDEILKEITKNMPRHVMRGMGEIDWPRVAEKYVGVEISPYIYQKRLSSHWYYGWDCASGVIWDISAVKEFRLFAAYSPKSSNFERL